MPGWIQRIGPDGRSIFVPKGEASPTPRGAMVVPDTPDYTSPVDGRLVSGRKQRREDLKRNGCVEYDPGQRETAHRIREERLERISESMVDRMRWHKA